jgi:hypothetical protein
MLFSGKQSSNQSFILNNSFIQFEDMSAKFSLSASVLGHWNLRGVALDVDGTVDFAIGLGLDRMSDKIYFSELKSVGQSLRDNASWQKIGVLDASVIITFDRGVVGKGLRDFLHAFPKLTPILSIESKDLFSGELPSVKLDLDLL